MLCIPSHAEASGVVFLEGVMNLDAAKQPEKTSFALAFTQNRNVGSIPEVLDQGRAGWLVEPGNH